MKFAQIALLAAAATQVEAGLFGPGPRSYKKNDKYLAAMDNIKKEYPTEAMNAMKEIDEEIKKSVKAYEKAHTNYNIWAAKIENAIQASEEHKNNASKVKKEIGKVSKKIKRRIESGEYNNAEAIDLLKTQYAEMKKAKKNAEEGTLADAAEVMEEYKVAKNNMKEDQKKIRRTIKAVNKDAKDVADATKVITEGFKDFDALLLIWFI